MICQILITYCLLLNTQFTPLVGAKTWVSPFWQAPVVVANVQKTPAIPVIIPKVAGARVPSPKPTPTPAPTSWDSMVPLINKERLLANLPALTQNPKLDVAAKNKACDMVNRKYFAHKDPDGKDAWHLFVEAGYKYQYAGENLAEGFDNDVSAMAKFMGSQAHKDNILNTHYKEVGIGRCGQYIVQHYGRR